LSNDDAKTFYNLSAVGMPVLVFGSRNLSDGRVFSAKKPNLTAQEYLAADLGGNFVFLEKNKSVVAPIASITKLVSALVATEYLNLESTLTVQKSMLASTSRPRLESGQRVTPYQLLFPLLMESSNEAAEVLAQSSGREHFVALMNEKARAVGMLTTHFSDPAGSESGDTATPEDLFALAKYIYYNRSFLFRLAAGHLEDSAYGFSHFANLQNFNDFSGDERFVGGKVGETSSAGQTALYVFNLPIGDSVRPVAIILLGSNDRASDARQVLDYISNNFQ
jgi:D-alanyl-D-alanine carboxypeptidase